MAINHPSMGDLWPMLKKNRLASQAMLEIITSTGADAIINGPFDIYINTMTNSWYSARHLDMVKQLRFYKVKKVI